MTQEEFIEKLTTNINDLSKEEIYETISIIAKAIPKSKYEKILCTIQNKKGALKIDEDKLDKEMEEIKIAYDQIKDGNICFECYAYQNGFCGMGGEEYDYNYYLTTNIANILDKAYEFGKSLIYQKQYSKALEIFNLILFTNYYCNEVSDPEYDDTDEIYDTFEVEITDLSHLLDFDLDYVCLYGIYATIISYNKQDKYSKIYKYLSLCTHHSLKDALNLGIEKIDNLNLFYTEWISYLEKNNNSPKLLKDALELKNIMTN